MYVRLPGWRALLGRSRRANRGHQQGTDIELELFRRSARDATCWLGLALACLSVEFGDSWVTKSPLFEVLGVAGSFVCLSACWAAGFVLWVFAGEWSVCEWAAHLWPCGAEPYRSALGVLAFCVLLSSVWGLVSRLPDVRPEWFVWVRRVLWALVVGISAAVLFAGFLRLCA